jgi:hypothetical protein
VPENAWLAIVIGISGVVAIVGIGLVSRMLRPARSRRAASSERDTTSASAERRPGSGGRSGFALAAFGRPRHQRSVVGNFERAYRRIDSVDPYAVQRRIGEALADSGLVSAGPAAPQPARRVDTWPFGKTHDRQPGEEET